MFASFDPVALDQACADACLKATPIENSQLGEHLAEPGWHCHHDHFKDSNPNIEWKATLDQAEKIGLGTREYELKIIKISNRNHIKSRKHACYMACFFA